jgi:hypothetical protein
MKLDCSVGSGAGPISFPHALEPLAVVAYASASSLKPLDAEPRDFTTAHFAYISLRTDAMMQKMQQQRFTSSSRTVCSTTVRPRASLVRVAAQASTHAEYSDAEAIVGRRWAMMAGVAGLGLAGAMCGPHAALAYGGTAEIVKFDAGEELHALSMPPHAP